MSGNLGDVIKNILSSVGISVSSVKLLKEGKHLVKTPMCVFMGIVTRNNERKGVISLEFEKDFAEVALDAMMPGFDVAVDSELGVSALSELTNMISGNVLPHIAPNAITTPPTTVVGFNMAVLLNTLPSYKIIVDCSGTILAIGLSFT